MRQCFRAAVVTGLLAAAGCTGSVAAPGSAVADPFPVVTVAPPSSSATDLGTATTDAWGPIPSCANPASSIATGSGAPPPDICVFDGSSPDCPIDATVVVRQGMAVTTSTRITGTPTGGFGRWGGRGGGSMCFGAYPDGSVHMTNADLSVLVEPDGQAIAYGARTDLARSGGVWGVVVQAVATVVVQDGSRPKGVAAQMWPASGSTSGIDGSTVRTPGPSVFVAPVSAGPVTITALDAAGRPMDVVTLG